MSDNGLGMEPELAQRAFELFTQGERSADRTQGGLGIGLARVKHLVELHGGSVSAHSGGRGRQRVCHHAAGRQRRDRGSRPAALAAAADLLEPCPGANLQVLLVDDNADAAAMLALIVDAAGHAVTVEHSAQAALLVAVTGYGQPSDREASQQAGFDDHFVKPVDSTRLIGLLANRQDAV